MPEVTSYAVYIAFIGFIGLNLLLGLFSSKRVQTIKDFATANRSIDSGTLTITFIATMVGARYVGIRLLDPTFYGIIDPFYQALGYMIIVPLLAFYVFPKLPRFENAYTLGNIMGRLYGRNAQLLTGVICTMFSIIFLTCQFAFLSKVKMLGLSPVSIIIIVGAVTTLYTIFGGIRSVSITDILQFFFIVLGFGFIAYKVISMIEGKSVGYLLRTAEKLNPKNLRVWNHSGLYPTLTAAFYVTLFPTIFLTPPVLQRILMAKNNAQMQKSLIGFACFYPILRVVMVIIGFGILILCNPVKGVPEVDALPMLARSIFKDSIWGQICTMLLIVSVCISTIDSFLNAAIVVVIEDIIKPLREARKQTKAINETVYIPVVAAFFGMLTVLLSIFFHKIPPILLGHISKIFLSSLCIPFIAGVLGFKGNKPAFYVSVFTLLATEGALAILAYAGYPLFTDYLSHSEIEGIGWTQALCDFFPAAVALSALCFFAMIYDRKKGFTFEQTMQQPSNTYWIGWRRNWSSFWKSPVDWAERKMHLHGSRPTIVGFVLITWYMISLVMRHQADKHVGLSIGINVGCSALCLLLIIHDLWKRILGRFFGLFWFLCLFICLPLRSMLFFWYQPSDTLLELIVSIVFFSILVGRSTFIIFMVLSIGISSLIYALADGSYQYFSYDTTWLAVLFGYYLIIMLLAFNYKKTSINTEKMIRNKLFTKVFGQEIRKELEDADPLSLIEDLQQKNQIQFDVLFSKKDFEVILKKAANLQRSYLRAINKTLAFQNLIDYDYILSKHVTTININFLLHNIEDMLPVNVKQNIQITYPDNNTDFNISIVPDLFYYIMKILLRRAFYQGGASQIALALCAESRTLHIIDNGKEIPPAIRPYLWDPFASFKKKISVGLPFVKLILDSFKADIALTSNKEGSQFSIRFPAAKQK